MSLPCESWPWAGMEGARGGEAGLGAGGVRCGWDGVQGRGWRWEGLRCLAGVLFLRNEGFVEGENEKYEEFREFLRVLKTSGVYEVFES